MVKDLTSEVSSFFFFFKEFLSLFEGEREREMEIEGESISQEEREKQDPR